ncbi:MAG: hypothetical protein ACKOSQ_07255 [Planctomycetaceae bacterium]
MAIGTVVMVGLHLVLSWVRGRAGVWQIVACGVAGGAVAHELGACSWPFTVCTQAFLLMLYLHFYVGVDRSVSLRILHELTQATAGGLAAEDLERVYPRRSMFEHRVALLVRKGWLRERSGRYTAARWTTPLVVATRSLRGLFGLRETW